MAKGISLSPVVQTFPLLTVDPEGEVTVTIRQVRAGDQIRINEMYAMRRRVWDYAPGEDEARSVKLESHYNEAKVKRLMAFLTVSDCNLINLDTEMPIFKFKEDKNGFSRVDMTEDAFNRLWDALPSEVTDEIVDCIFEVNPQWGPNAGE